MHSAFSFYHFKANFSTKTSTNKSRYFVCTFYNTTKKIETTLVFITHSHKNILLDEVNLFLNEAFSRKIGVHLQLCINSTKLKKKNIFKTGIFAKCFAYKVINK